MTGLLLSIAMIALTLVGEGRAMARQAPERGSKAPPITLKDSTGATVSTESMSGKTFVLIFGELDQDRTTQACADVTDVLSARRFDGEAIVPMLIVASEVSAQQWNDLSKEGRSPRVVLSDVKREAFEAYRVIVLPTVVVVDTNGKIVHRLPAHMGNFKELLTDSILVSTGKMTESEFELAIDPRSPRGESPEKVKSDHLVHLGQELARHGMVDDAEARFKEALSLVPGHAGATLALGELMLAQGKLEDAAAQFRAVLNASPDSADAAMGIAAVEISRGGEAMSRAEASLSKLLAKDPRLSRARYLMGQIREKQGDCAKAMLEYRAAAEILLAR